jgi:ferric-dicitrate binding protein FerR (iron transport regulator)
MKDKLDIPEEKKPLLDWYLSGKLSPEKLDEFVDFVQTNEGQASIIQNMDETGFANYSQDLDKKRSDQIFNRISVKIDRPKKHFHLAFRIAASFLLLVALGFGAYYSNLFTGPPVAETLCISGEQPQPVVLPDGTQVRLNSGSTLSYSKYFGKGNKRQVTLNGEAFFEVAKNPEKPFVIDAGASEIKVLGTVFNVKARQGINAVVAVQEGKVSFKGKEQTEGIILTANEVGVLAKDGNVKKIDQSAQNYFSWFNHFLDFDNMPLSQVVEQLSLIFDVQIEVANPTLKNKYFTAYMKGKSIDEVMNQLALSMELKLEKLNGKYFLK